MLCWVTYIISNLFLLSVDRYLLEVWEDLFTVEVSDIMNWVSYFVTDSDSYYITQPYSAIYMYFLLQVENYMRLYMHFV